MNGAANKGRSSWNGWGLAAIIVLLAFAAWQGARMAGLFNQAETVNQAWFDNYTDRFLSESTTVTVNGKANKRLFPTAQKTEVKDSFASGTRLKGRWVRGADARILWFKTSDGHYLWEGNLVGDPAIMTAASQTALDPSKAAQDKTPVEPVSPPPQRAGASQAEATTSADLPTVEAQPAQAYDRRIVSLLSAAVGDPGLAAEIAGNADLVAPAEVSGGSQLTWSMCAKRCDFDYSSAVIVSSAARRPRVQVCLHDGRRMSGWSEWFEAGRSAGRRPGLCPSSLLAVE